MRSGLLTTSLNTVSGKYEKKWQLCASHYTTEHTACGNSGNPWVHPIQKVATLDTPLHRGHGFSWKHKTRASATTESLSNPGPHCDVTYIWQLKCTHEYVETPNYTTNIGARVYTEPRFTASLAVVRVKYSVFDLARRASSYFIIILLSTTPEDVLLTSSQALRHTADQFIQIAVRLTRFYLAVRFQQRSYPCFELAFR